MRVRVWQEKRYGELGETRWAVNWYTVTPKGQKRIDASPDYEVDFDRDLECNYEHFTTQAAARNFAATVACDSFFGTATVVKEILDWMSEADNIACFEESNEREEVAA